MVSNMKLLVVCAAACLSGSCAASVLGQRSVLASAMQPDVVAKTLSAVQGEWKAQVAIFTDCDSTAKLPGSTIVNCKDARSSFTKSCGTISNAIVQGSGGDKDIMNEYMGDVCRQRSMLGWHQQQCNSIALAIGASMSADRNQNRVGFKSTRLCDKVWGKLFEERTQEVAKEKADHEAAEKKAAEETAAEMAEAQKKEEERKKAEKVKREKQEAADKVAEAKAKAAEAAAKAAEKKAEAEAAAASAKQKMAEVAADKQKQETAAAAAKAVKKTETKPVPKADAKPKVVVAVAKPEASKKVEPVKAVKKEVVAAKVVAQTAKFLVSAAAPAAAAAGAPKAAGAPGGAGGVKEILTGKMSLKAAEQGFSGKAVKHADGKTAAADWQNEYSTKGASFLASAAAPAPAKAGAPKAAGAPGAAKVNLNDKMPLKAAEQGFTGKAVKHSDGKTVASDWQKEYGSAK